MAPRGLICAVPSLKMQSSPSIPMDDTMNSISSKPFGAVLTALLLTCAAASSVQAQSAPAWWTSRSVLASGASADDYAVINQGQVKHLVVAAAAEVASKLGASSASYWTALTSTISAWQSSSATADDYAAVSVGQLKAIALPFYQRLKDAGKIGALPSWATTAGSDDYASANIGQAKALFAFTP